MDKTTNELLKILEKRGHEAYLKEHSGDLIESPLCDYLASLIDRKNLNKAEVIQKSNIQTNYAYQIFSGVRIPSRDKLIALCFGMNLTLDEAQTLLKYAGFAQLYPKNKRDSIIISSLKNHTSVINCNILLGEYGLSTI